MKLKGTLESLVPSTDSTLYPVLGKDRGAENSMGLGQSAGYPATDILGVSAPVINKKIFHLKLRTLTGGR